MLKFLLSTLAYCFLFAGYGYAENTDDFLVTDKEYIANNQKQIQSIVAVFTKNINDADFQTQQALIKKYYYVLGVSPERLNAEMDYAGNVKRLWKSEVMKFARIGKNYHLRFYKIPNTKIPKTMSEINEMAIIELNTEKIMFVKFKNQWKASR